MHRYIVLLAFLLATVGCITGMDYNEEVGELARPADFLNQAVVGPNGDGTYVVPTNQLIDPAGESVLFPGRPVGVVQHPLEPVLLVKSKSDVVLIDADTLRVSQTMPMPRDGGSYCGIVWSKKGDTFWVTSSKRYLHRASRQPDGLYGWDMEIDLPGPGGKGDPAPGGIALDDARGLIYVCLSRNNSVGVVDMATQKVVEEVPVGIVPFDVKLHRGMAFVTNWGGSRPAEGTRTSLTSGSKISVDERGIANTGSITVIQVQQLAAVQVKERQLAPRRLGLLELLCQDRAGFGIAAQHGVHAGEIRLRIGVALRRDLGPVQRPVATPGRGIQLDQPVREDHAPGGVLADDLFVDLGRLELAPVLLVNHGPAGERLKIRRRALGTTHADAEPEEDAERQQCGDASPRAAACDAEARTPGTVTHAGGQGGSHVDSSRKLLLSGTLLVPRQGGYVKRNTRRRTAKGADRQVLFKRSRSGAVSSSGGTGESSSSSSSSSIHAPGIEDEDEDEDEDEEDGGPYSPPRIVMAGSPSRM